MYINDGLSVYYDFIPHFVDPKTIRDIPLHPPYGG